MQTEKQSTPTHTPYDGRGAEQIIEAWLLEHGDTKVDDDGDTLSDLLEWMPEIRDDLENRIARALGSAKKAMYDAIHR